LCFLLNHERDEITGIADDEAGIRAVNKASMSLFLGANLRECAVGTALAGFGSHVIR
jgi:hypothetical protein